MPSFFVRFSWSASRSEPEKSQSGVYSPPGLSHEAIFDELLEAVRNTAEIHATGDAGVYNLHITHVEKLDWR